MLNILKSHRLIAELTLLTTLCFGCEKAAEPADKRLVEDIARWENELNQTTEKAKSDRENAAHYNAEAELLRSRIARLKAKLPGKR